MSVAAVPIVRRGPSPAEPVVHSAALPAEATSSPSASSQENGQRFSLNSIDWQTYRKISEALTGRHLRITFDRGRLEFKTISCLRGTLCRLFAHLIAILTDEFSLPCGGCGDMTCDRESLDRGIEPDE